jgi:hypothetical protein
VLAPVPEHDPASVCGPAKAEGIVPGFGAIRSRLTTSTPGLFSAGDELLIDAGALNLMRVGEHYVVRRRYPTTLVDGRVPVVGEHSSGLLQVVDIHGSAATAVVVYACDEMMTGDYLAPFHPQEAGAREPGGAPAFDRAARVLFGAAGQMFGTTHRLLVIGAGTRQGIRAGQRLTIFRRPRWGNAPPTILGEAVVVAVRGESATVRVERAVDVIFLGADGDWVAPQRPTVDHSRRSAAGHDSPIIGGPHDARDRARDRAGDRSVGAGQPGPYLVR